MDKVELSTLLHLVAEGKLSPDDAALQLKMQPIQEVGEYAKVDMHRGIRQGVPEVIYGAGKNQGTYPRDCENNACQRAEDGSCHPH